MLIARLPYTEETFDLSFNSNLKTKNPAQFGNRTRANLYPGMHKNWKKINEKSMHRPGIEPGPPAWQASILPLNQRCLRIRVAELNPIKAGRFSGGDQLGGGSHEPPPGI